MQLECHLIFYQELSKLYDNYNNLNLMVLDGITNDNQII
jgi:glutathione peroxidase-family protein